MPQSLAAFDEPQVPDDAVGPIAHAGELAALEMSSDSHEWRMPSAADVSISRYPQRPAASGMIGSFVGRTFAIL
jgi:hypothetical protein